MKNYILRTLVATLSFGISLVFVYFVTVNYQPEYCGLTYYSSAKNVSQTTNHQKINNKVELNFLGFSEFNDDILAKFEILNNTSEEITYRSYNLKNDSGDISINYGVKVNSKDINLGWCGTGMMPYQLKSSESKTFTVSLNQIAYHWKKGESIQIGFYYNEPSINQYFTAWSENLPIYGEFENKLLKRKREFEKLIN